MGSGIDRKDISTTQVSLQPQFAGGDSTAIVGYRASNSIDVKIRKLDTASQALALIVSTGGDATRINSVNYSIEDDSQLVKDARARAFNDAKDRAQQYAQLSGLDLGKVISITESGGPTPPTPLPNYAGRRDGGRAVGARPADGQFLGDGDLRTDLPSRYTRAAARCLPDRDAVEDGGARQRVELTAVVELVDVDAGLVGGHSLAGAATVVTPAVRQRNDAASHAWRQFDRRHQIAARTLDGGVVGQPELGGVVRMDLQRAAVRSAREGRQVVHPAVVRAQVPATDEDEAVVAAAQGFLQPSLAASAISASGASSIRPERVL